VPPFKPEKTNDLTPPLHAGPALSGEFATGLGLLKKPDRHPPKPGSGAGYAPGKHLFWLMLMQNGGGRSLEDLRQIRKDNGLRELLKLERHLRTAARLRLYLAAGVRIGSSDSRSSVEWREWFRRSCEVWSTCRLSRFWVAVKDPSDRGTRRG